MDYYDVNIKAHSKGRVYIWEKDLRTIARNKSILRLTLDGDEFVMKDWLLVFRYRTKVRNSICYVIPLGDFTKRDKSPLNPFLDFIENTVTKAKKSDKPKVTFLLKEAVNWLDTVHSTNAGYASTRESITSHLLNISIE